MKICPLCEGGALRPLGQASRIPLARCATCGSVVAGVPAPEPEAYSLGYYERSYLAFKDERLHFLRRLLTRLGEAAGRLVIDSGCGAGLSVDVLKGLGWRVVGIEPSPAGAALVAERGHAVARASASVLPAASQTASAVLLLDVLAHLDDPRAAVREAARVLAPGGRILVKTPHRPAWAYWLATRLPGGLGRGLVHLPHQRQAISRPALAALLKAEGFEGVRVEASGEAIPLRSHLGGSWGSRAKVLLVAALELFYGGRSSVATGALRVAPVP